MSRAELDSLGSRLISFAQETLAEAGVFQPLGAIADEEGEVQFLAAGEDTADFRAQIELLRQHLRQLAEAGAIRAAAICFDTFLHRDGKKRDAIACALEHSSGESFTRFVPYVKSRAKAAAGERYRFQEAFEDERERDIFGCGGLVLTLEDAPPVREPTLAQIASGVDALKPDGGPGFLILEGADNEYAQAAGGDGKYTAEWRHNLPQGGFRHWVAGRPGNVTSRTKVAVPTNGAQVTVRRNEILSAAEVKVILKAFALRQERPAEFTWRDIAGEL